MLTVPTKRLWLAATCAAVAALLAGVIVAVGGTGFDDGYVADGPAAGQQLVQPQETCPPTADPDDECIGDRDPGTPGNPGNPGDTPDGGDGRCYFGSDGAQQAGNDAGDPNIVLVAQGRVEVPCHTDAGFYLDGCYWGPPPSIQLLPPAESGDDEVVLIAWQPTPPPGHEGEEGQWLYGRCYLGFVGDTLVFDAAIYWRWFPEGTVPTVTPEQVAQDWLASVTLTGVEFDLAPPTTGAGVVNLPVWLGVNEGSENAWGPFEPEPSHCIGDVCVFINAYVDEVTWTMGDGETVTCAREQHEAWEPGKDYLQPGDNCHHFYRRASRDQPGGEYEITATSHWVVPWRSQVGDTTGELETERTASTALQIDEIQVLTR
jgi:hypothetical protein